MEIKNNCYKDSMQLEYYENERCERADVGKID
jgi:hypothetical protein